MSGAEAGAVRDHLRGGLASLRSGRREAEVVTASENRSAEGTAALSPRWRVSQWLLNHPSRVSWVLIELLRPWNGRKLRNAWWQIRHYGDVDAFQALYETHRRSYGNDA